MLKLAASFEITRKRRSLLVPTYCEGGCRPTHPSAMTHKGPGAIV